ncbi:Long chain base biosynthesis protein 1 [Abeliophyllum distichum]|uniref:Long chain base biosynthesis protein 1 n=1 Tax=Abeliophyllum distichum TaxID=126358 RepID=A0ABD1VY23_9LAMI
MIAYGVKQESCTKAVEKYGVGSCGPRRFYGTIDVHLDCEARIAKFLGTSNSILYAYGLSTMFSIIPAFSKKDDIIVAVGTDSDTSTDNQDIPELPHAHSKELTHVHEEEQQQPQLQMPLRRSNKERTNAILGDYPRT